MRSPSTTRIDRGEPARPGCSDPALLQALADPATYCLQTPVAVHETHASWVFVTGARAYKIKKPVALGFLDYRTLARRHAACREEVRVNRELAPDIYLGVCAIVRSGAGFELAREHDPEAVEYVVEMRSFSASDSLAGLIAAGALRPEHLAAVAQRVAEFHRAAAVAPGGGPREVLEMWRENVRGLAAACRGLGWRLDVADGFGEAFARAHEPEILARRRAGLIRDGHGDLRCEHVLVRPSIRVVDRVEFDPSLRQTDLACDLAFLTMDLEACGQRWAAEELIAAYRREGMDPGSDALASFYAAHHALIRAKVALIAASERTGEARLEQLARADAMWTLGERLCWRARAPVAVLVCGPAASGKSTLAAEISRRSGLAVLSSDTVRKRAAGLPATARAAPEHYSAQFTRATYRQLGQEARRALAGGGGVIVDATCRSRAARAALLRDTDQEGATRLVVRCRVPVAVAVERARRRLREAGRVSDATPEIVAEQHRSFEALEELEPACVLELDTEQPLADQLVELTLALDDRLASCRAPPASAPQAATP